MEKIYTRTKTIQEDKVSGFCPGCMHSTVIKLIGEVLEEMNCVDRAAAVGHGGAACAVALHNALIAVAFADAGNVDLVAGSEGVRLDFVADVHVGSAVQLELLQDLLELLQAGLLLVAQLGLGQLALQDILEAQLDGGVAVGLVGLLLHHGAGAGGDDGDRDHVPGLVEDLRHADLLADNGLFHVSFLLNKVIG